MTHFPYIIYSQSSDKYYTGYTANLENRIKKHNLGELPLQEMEGLGNWYTLKLMTLKLKP